MDVAWGSGKKESGRTARRAVEDGDQIGGEIGIEGFQGRENVR